MRNNLSVKDVFLNLRGYEMAAKTTAKKNYSHKRLSRRIYSKQRIIFNNTPKPERVIANFTGLTRNDTMDGKEFLVAPMIMIVEGVLNGTGGPLYYPAEELSKTPQVWNMKPVVVNHPSHNGYGISACDPDIIRNRGVGWILNTTFEDGKLKAEAWIDLNKAAIVDNRIVEAIENKEVMELSTGLFTDNENVEGEFNGKEYIAIARNYRPDHLAILPDTQGACSVSDGAGFLRLNEAHDSVEISISAFDSKKAVKFFEQNLEHIGKTIKEVIENQISHSDIWSLLSSALQKDNENLWIDEVFDSFFIYVDDGILYKQNYSINDGEVNLIGEREKVTRKIIFETENGAILNNKNTRKDNVMEKDKLVEAIIANKSTQWTSEDTEALMAMNESVLNKMLPVEKEDHEDKNKEETVVDNTVQDNASDLNKKYYEDMPEDMKAVFNHGKETLAAEKNNLINIITANENCSFSKEQLQAKDLNDLKGIASLVDNKEKESNSIPVHIFNGQQEVVTGNEGDGVDVLETPSMSFS
jgi:hypothetical protein